MIIYIGGRMKKERYREILSVFKSFEEFQEFKRILLRDVLKEKRKLERENRRLKKKLEELPKKEVLKKLKAKLERKTEEWKSQKEIIEKLIKGRRLLVALITKILEEISYGYEPRKANLKDWLKQEIKWTKDYISILEKVSNVVIEK